MQVTWIGGWGMTPAALHPLAQQFVPGATHAFFLPSRSAIESAVGSDCVVGWSLGAWRILDAAARGVGFRGRVLLLAPFLAFCSEYNLGGRCSQIQVKWLRRWVQREPLAALHDFYQRAGLNESPTALPYAMEDLLEGLDRLAEDASPSLRRFASSGLPENWSAVIGDSDPLLDGSTVCRTLPGCRLVAGAGHALEKLLASVEEQSYAV
ncbi:MAG TPA: hypothetical protein VEC99_02985 [Clostridia bacterium]|nr:hypothetical protein [Clostridia bacterium]